MVDSKELRKKIDIAKESVNGLEEPFKTESFRIILDNLMKTGSGEKPNKISAKNKDIKIKPDSDDVLAKFDVDEYGFVGELKAGRDQAISLLDWAFKEHPEEGLTPKEMSDILKSNFKVSLHQNAINVALGRVTGKYVGRTKEGNSYRYTITKKGQDYVKKIKTPSQK